MKGPSRERDILCGWNIDISSRQSWLEKLVKIYNNYTVISTTNLKNVLNFKCRSLIICGTNELLSIIFGCCGDYLREGTIYVVRLECQGGNMYENAILRYATICYLLCHAAILCSSMLMILLQIESIDGCIKTMIEGTELHSVVM